MARLRLGIPVWDEEWRSISCLDEGGRWRGEETDASWGGTWRPIGLSRALGVNLQCLGHAPLQVQKFPIPWRFVPSPVGPSPSLHLTLPH